MRRRTRTKYVGKRANGNADGLRLKRSILALCGIVTIEVVMPNAWAQSTTPAFTSPVTNGVTTAGQTVVGGTQEVQSGGQTTVTTIGALGVQNVESGGLATQTTIDSAGIQNINGGSAKDTTLTGGLLFAMQNVNSGGTATNTTLNDESTQNINSGGTATNTTINSGGTQNVGPGGTANNTTINGGQQYIQGGTANGDIVELGTVFQQSGTIENSTIAGGALVIAGNNLQSTGTLTMQGGSIAFQAPLLRAVPLAASSFMTYTIANLTGQGSLIMYTNVAGQSGDFLNINASGGSYKVLVVDRSVTPPDNQTLPIINANAGQQFALPGGTTDVGPYKYILEQQGNEWVLAPPTGPDGQPEQEESNTTEAARALEAAPQVIWYGQLQQMYRRLGDLRMNPTQDGAWARVYGQKMNLDPAGQVSAKINMTGIEAGVDRRFPTAIGDWYAGLTAGSAQADQDFGSAGTGSAHPWSVGAYASWLHPAGWYADFVARYNAMTQSLSTTDSAQPVSASYHVNGYTVSAEGGRRLSLGESGWWVEPSLELSATHMSSANYQTSVGALVDQRGGTSVLGRAGVRVGGAVVKDAGRTIEPFVGLDAVQQFGGSGNVNVDGVTFSTSTRGAYGIVSTGVAAHFAQRVNAYADVSYAKGERYEQPWSFNVGVRYLW